MCDLIRFSGGTQIPCERVSHIIPCSLAFAGLVHTYQLSRNKFIVGCWKGSFKQCRNSSTGIRFLLLETILGLCHEQHCIAVNTKRRRTRILRSGKYYIFICAGAWSLEVKDGRRKSCDLVQCDLRCFLLRPLWHCDAREEWWLRLSLMCWAHSSPSVIAWIQPSSQSATITYQLPAV